MTHVLLRTLITVAWLAALPGCSMLFVDGPPRDHAQRAYFDCTSSNLGPITDTVLAVSYGGQAVAVALGSDHIDGSASGRTPIALLYLGMGVLFGASAMGGFDDTAECDAAIEDMNRRRMIRPTNWVPNSTATPAQPAANGGCLNNEHCRGGRVCVQGTCMDYAPPPMPPPAPHEAPVLLFEVQTQPPAAVPLPPPPPPAVVPPPPPPPPSLQPAP